MNNNSIHDILFLLSSNKVKDKNDAINELISVLKTNNNNNFKDIDSKNISKLIITLITYFNSEFYKFRESTSSLPIENRIYNIIYVIRLVVEKYSRSSHFKLKSLKALISTFPELFKYGTSLNDSILMHASVTLLCCVQSPIFKLKFVSNQYISIIDLLTHFLRKQYFEKKIFNTKIINNLASALIELLKLDSVSVLLIAEDSMTLIKSYFKHCNFEHSNSEIILKLAFQIFLKTYLINIKWTFSLIQMFYDYLLQINTTNDKILQIATNFDILISDLLLNTIPLRDLSNITNSFLNDYTLSKLLSYKHNLFSLSDLKFESLSSTPFTDLAKPKFKRVHLFQFDDYQLVENSSIQPWLNLLSVVKILNSFFILKKSQSSLITSDSDDDSDTPNIFKRRKISNVTLSKDSTWSSLLFNSKTFEEFIIFSLDSFSNDEAKLTTILQITSFYLSYCIVTDQESILELKSALFKQFERNPHFFNLIAFALIPLLSQPYHNIIHSTDFNHILKLSLPMIKDPNSCLLSTKLIINMIMYTNTDNIILDIQSKQLVINTFELSTVNGPTLFNNTSFEFWILFNFLIDDVDLVEKKTTYQTTDEEDISTSHSIWHWIIAKMNSQFLLSLNNDNLELWRLIAFLFNLKIPTSWEKNYKLNESYLLNTPCWDGDWQYFLNEWECLKDHRYFLLQTDGLNNYKLDKGSQCVHSNESFAFVRKISIDTLLKFLNSYLRSFEEKTSDKVDNNLKFDMLYFLALIEILIKDNEFINTTNFEWFNFYEDFEVTANIELQKLHDNDINYSIYVRNILIDIPNLPVFGNINVREILSSSPVDLDFADKTADSSIDIAFADSNDNDESELTIGDIQNIHYDSNTLRLMQYSFAIASQQSNNEILLNIVDKIKTMNAVDVLISLKLINRWLKSIDLKTITVNTLELFSEIIASSILGSQLGTSSFAMGLLSEYLCIIRSVWTFSGNIKLSTDCNDIFNWIITRYEDADFCGSAAILKFAMLLIALLKNHNITKESEPYNKQKCYGILFKCIKSVDLIGVVFIIPQLVEYMDSVGPKNKQLIFNDLFSIHYKFYINLECCSLFMLLMSKLVKMKKHYFPYVMQQVLGLTTLNPYYFYLKAFLKYVVKYVAGGCDLRSLFDIIKFDAIKYWIDISSFANSMDDQFTNLFDYPTLEDFIVHNYKEVVAVHYALGSTYSRPIENVVKITNKSHSELMAECVYICIPLAFTTKGIKDGIFKACDELMGKRWSNRMTTDNITFIRWVLYFVDFEDLNEVRKSFHSNKYCIQDAKLLFFSLSSSLSTNNSTYIDFAVGISLISNYFSKAISASDIELLLLWLINDLHRTKTKYQQLHTLKEIKLICCFYRHLMNDEFIYIEIIKHLSDLIIQPILSNEVLPLLLFCLQNSYSMNIDCSYILIQLFANLLTVYQEVEYSRLISGCMKKLTELGIESWTSIDEASICTLHFMESLLNGKSEQDELLNTSTAAINSILDKAHIDINDLNLISMIMKISNLDVIDGFASDNLSHSCIQSLLDLKVNETYYSSNFSNFVADHVAKYIRQTVTFVDFSPLDMSTDWNFGPLFERQEPIEDLMNIFFTFKQEVVNCSDSKLQFVYFSLCALFHQKVSSSSLLSPKLKDLINNNLKKSSQIQQNVFDFLFSTNRSSPMTTSFSALLDEDISYEKWLFSLASRLFLDLSNYCDLFKYFRHIFEHSVIFCEKCIPVAVFALILLESKNNHQEMLEFINAYFKIQLLSTDRKKTALLSTIVLMIRDGFYSGIKPFIHLYESLNIKAVYEHAILTNESHIGLMLHEEFNMAHKTNDYENLKSLYLKLEERDLLAGLPVNLSVSGVVSFLNETQPNSWKSFLFSNAYVDNSYNNMAPDVQAFVKIADNNNFTKIASNFSLESDKIMADVNEQYEWNLQLRNWTLPTPRYIDSLPKAMYQLVKSISIRGENCLDSIDCLSEEIKANCDRFTSRKEWFETVQEVYWIKDVILSKSSYPNGFENWKNIITSRYNGLQFESFKIQKLAEYTVSLLMAQKIPESKPEMKTRWYIDTYVNLSEYINLAIDNNLSQEALKAAYLLDSISKKLENNSYSMTYSSDIVRYITFVNSQALWASQEQRAPILMLKEVVENWPDKHSAVLKDNPLFSQLYLNYNEVCAYLTEWSSEVRFETPTDIYHKYVEAVQNETDVYEKSAIVYEKLGKFLANQTQTIKDDEILERKKILKKNTIDLDQLKIIYSKPNLTSEEKKETEHHFTKLKQQHKSDSALLKELLQQRQTFIQGALEFFVKTLSISNNFDDEILDKYCNLWFQNELDDVVNDRLLNQEKLIPSFKYLPWISQIVSKLSTEQSHFQKVLQQIVKRVIINHPYNSLYSIMNIKFHKKYIKDQHSNMGKKIRVVEMILDNLNGNTNFYKEFILPIDTFCSEVIKLASLKFTRTTKSFDLTKYKYGKYWLQTLINDKLPLVTATSISMAQNELNGDIPYFTSVNSSVQLSRTGLSLPKIVSFTLSDGKMYKVLMKGSNDDLKQDAVMQQVFSKVNTILITDKKLKKLNLKMRTYQVIPLGPYSGLIEFVSNSKSLHEILRDLHRNDEISFENARKMMKAVQGSTSNKKLQCFEKIITQIKPQLRNFFFNSFFDPEKWFEAKIKYTRGVAVSSIVGFILGLGDRHLNNILLDTFTGEPIHIDFGIAFDQGLLLPIPETIPFRLTRDIVDGFGVTGVEGIFRKTSEYTYSILRLNHDRVMCVLNILKWDPLYSWVMSPMKKYRHLLEMEEGSLNSSGIYGLSQPMSYRSSNSELEDNSQALRALRSIEHKLNGNNLGVESTVQELITQATDTKNLSQLFSGWSQFY